MTAADPKIARTAKQLTDLGLVSWSRVIDAGKVGAVIEVKSLKQFMLDNSLLTMGSISGFNPNVLDIPAAVKVIQGTTFEAAFDSYAVHEKISALQQKKNWHVVPRFYAFAVSNPFKGRLRKHKLYFYCMELVNGQSLSKLLQDDNYVPTEKMTRDLTKQFVRLWKLGYVHGDPHKGNVILTNDNTFMLIDVDGAIRHHLPPGEENPLDKYGNHHDDDLLQAAANAQVKQLVQATSASMKRKANTQLINNMPTFMKPRVPGRSPKLIR